MENLTLEFAVILFLTLIITRISSYYLHDFNAYENRVWKGKKYDKSKTITGVLRRGFGIDLHHMHVGAAMLISISPFIILLGLNFWNLLFLTIGLSMFLDEIIPWAFDIEYFGKESLIISLILHVLAMIAFINL